MSEFIQQYGAFVFGFLLGGGCVYTFGKLIAEDLFWIITIGRRDADYIDIKKIPKADEKGGE